MAKHEITAEEILQRIRDAGFNSHNQVSDCEESDDEKLDRLDERVERLLNITNQERKSTNMLFFVMYDIAHNKVRGYVAKYLIKKGCTRIQKSIFLADLPPDSVQSIKSDLAQVQAAYDNNDSILIVPVSTDEIRAMKIIGQNIDVDLITRNRNTLFF